MFGGNERLKILLITVAGMSTRFSESIGKECLKCIYYKNDFTESILHRLMVQTSGFDKYIIVGGYKFEELEQTINLCFHDIKDKIILVNNGYYNCYGSGYSLYLGLKKAVEFNFRELVFAEGDLFLDNESFMEIYKSNRDVITCNLEPISADKAVAFYYDINHHIHYIYDTNHECFHINEPFLGIFNSGQVWKFVQIEKLKCLVASLEEDIWKGTNLDFIQKYFENSDDYKIVRFKKWINCNTITDFEWIERISK